MKSSSIFGVLILMTIFCVSFSKGHASKDTKTGILICQTRDCYGEVVKEAKITIKSDKIIRKQRSDKNGIFKIQLQKGLYEITVERCGFKILIIKNVIVQENVENNINIPMEFHLASHESSKCNPEGKICKSLNQ